MPEEIITITLKELIPGAMFRVADKLADIATTIAIKVPQIKVNYIDLKGDKLIVSITKPETSTSIVPVVAAAIFLAIKWIAISLGVIAISWATVEVARSATGSELKEDLLAYAIAHPESAIAQNLQELMQTASPNIDWSTVQKIAIGSGALIGVGLLLNTFWPRKR